MRFLSAAPSPDADCGANTAWGDSGPPCPLRRLRPLLRSLSRAGASRGPPRLPAAAAAYGRRLRRFGARAPSALRHRSSSTARSRWIDCRCACHVASLSASSGCAQRSFDLRRRSSGSRRQAGGARSVDFSGLISRPSARCAGNAPRCAPGRAPRRRDITVPNRATQPSALADTTCAQRNSSSTRLLYGMRRSAASGRALVMFRLVRHGRLPGRRRAQRRGSGASAPVPCTWS